MYRNYSVSDILAVASRDEWYTRWIIQVPVRVSKRVMVRVRVRVAKLHCNHKCICSNANANQSVPLFLTHCVAGMCAEYSSAQNACSSITNEVKIRTSQHPSYSK